MNYVPYRTATQWKEYFGGDTSDQIKVAVDTLGALENLAAAGGGNTTSVFFVAQNGVYDYTATEAPQLANAVGKTVIGCVSNGGNVSVTLITWDDTTLHFDNGGVVFTGGELVTVYFQ